MNAAMALNSEIAHRQGPISRGVPLLIHGALKPTPNENEDSDMIDEQTALTPEARAALERMDAIGDAWAAISDLLIPEPDLHVVDRERLHRLVELLAGEYQAASTRFTRALHEG